MVRPLVRGVATLAILYSIIISTQCRRPFPHCNRPLGMSDGTIPDTHIRATSTRDPVLYGPQRGRLNVSLKTTGWCSSTAKGAKEYLEVDLGRDMRVAAVATQGVWVRNITTGRYDYTYMSNFFLSYKRSNDEKWRWRQYMENEVSVTLIQTNNHTGVERYDLLTPHIARYVRFVAHEGDGSMWCLKVELYGCPWTDQDGLVSYRVSQGNGRSNGPGLGDLRDVGYDGRRLAYGTKRGVLSGGLGQLVDGDLGRNVPWNDTENDEWIHWLGWRDPVTENPSVTFQFSSIRKFSLIRFHVLNQAGSEKLLFGKVVISFSKDGEYYAWKTVYEPSVYKRRQKNRALFLEVDVKKNVGKYVTCDFHYHGWWVLLSEVQIISDPMDDSLEVATISNKTVATNETKSTTVVPTDVVWDVEESGVKKKGFLVDAVLISSIVGGVVGVVLLVLGLYFCLKKRRTHSRRRTESDEPLNPLRIINPSKKNSLNRRNFEASRTAGKAKLKQIEIEREELEDEEEVCEKLNNWQRRNQCDELLLKNHDVTANLRPKSREVTLEEEKAEVLAEMRKISEESSFSSSTSSDY